MKALSIWQPFASLVVAGHKKIEVRTWATEHRGPLLICSTAGDLDLGDNRFAPGGHALGTVNLVDVRPMVEADIELACLGKLTKKERADVLRSKAWVFESPKEILPVPVKGKQGLFSLEIPLGPLPEEFIRLAHANDTLAHIEYYSHLVKAKGR
ncbi:MAG: ASCH domain-containing protein [Deltaproteobacteria bacterium]|nr:ASCH domain-containing protein [Deltaproteobacteria bacterium]